MKLLDPHERELIKKFVNLCEYPVVLDKKEVKILIMNFKY